MATALSTVLYFNVESSLEIWSLTLDPNGADKCIMSRHVPPSFGTTPRPEHWRFGRGGVIWSSHMTKIALPLETFFNDVWMSVGGGKIGAHSGKPGARKTNRTAVREVVYQSVKKVSVRVATKIMC